MRGCVRHTRAFHRWEHFRTFNADTSPATREATGLHCTASVVVHQIMTRCLENESSEAESHFCCSRMQIRVDEAGRGSAAQFGAMMRAFPCSLYAF